VRPFSPETVRRHSLTAWVWKEVPNPEPDGAKMVWIKARESAAESITLHEALASTRRRSASSWGNRRSR
jgi:hypothetical protein